MGLGCRREEITPRGPSWAAFAANQNPGVCVVAVAGFGAAPQGLRQQSIREHSQQRPRRERPRKPTGRVQQRISRRRRHRDHRGPHEQHAPLRPARHAQAAARRHALRQIGQQDADRERHAHAALQHGQAQHERLGDAVEDRAEHDRDRRAAGPGAVGILALAGAAAGEQPVAGGEDHGADQHQQADPGPPSGCPGPCRSARGKPSRAVRRSPAPSRRPSPGGSVSAERRSAALTPRTRPTGRPPSRLIYRRPASMKSRATWICASQ